MDRSARPTTAPRRLARALLAALAVAGCGGGSGGGGGGGDDPPSAIPPERDSDGLRIEITALGGATGTAGAFEVGDRIAVTFTITDADGAPRALAELESLRALVSGPTVNYQRVLADSGAPLTGSVDHGDGSYTFRFAPIPAVYLPPLNDTPAFGPGDGELTGQALLAGTYTVGLYGYDEYVVAGRDGPGETFRDVADDVRDLRLGATAGLLPRALVGQQNCDACHVRLEAHGGVHRNATICLLCHTSGAEDDNTGGATPGVSADFRVMIHRIHDGAHLPSVLGMTTLPDGARDYAAPPVPYQLAGADGVRDFSHVRFGLWPSLSEPTLRDAGHAALDPSAQALEDAQRRGVVACERCHGDPDGEGPAGAPANGGLAYIQLTRRACGSCHDDVVWELPYVANDQTMPPQLSDGTCIVCHAAQGDPLAVRDGHLHPLDDPAVDPGLHVHVVALTEAGASDGDGAVDPGESIAVTFTLTDDAGLPVDGAALASLSATISGPTWNLNLVLDEDVPPGALAGPQPYAIHLPQTRRLELVGRSTAAPGEVFTTSASPHWHALGAPTTVYAVTGSGAATVLSAAAPAVQNFVDVTAATGIARDDVVMLDAVPGPEEHLRVQLVDGARLWFSSPATEGLPFALRHDHAAGAPVVQVELTELTAGVDYALDARAGTITELSELGDGVAVLVTYTADFVLPEVYPGPLNDSPDLGETDGEWRGKSLVDGTYLLALRAARSVVAYGETNDYCSPSADAATPFAVGAPGPLEPWDLVASEQACLRCHGELRHHGGASGGLDACIVCHGTAGAEDRPPYVSGNAPATSGVSIGWRQMLHKIHRGAGLANASAYTVVTEGEEPWPDDFEERSWAAAHFPAQPSGTQDCASCHGAGNSAWTAPADRDHPTGQGAPVREWTTACSSCHDADAALVHYAVNTSAAGVEACAVCHDAFSSFGVALEHRVR